MVFIPQKKKEAPVEKKKLGFFKNMIVYRGNLIMVFLAASILIGSYLLIIEPGVAEIISSTDETEALSSEIELLEAQLVRFKKLEAEYNAVDQSKIDKVEDLVTVSPDLPNLYIQIAALAKKNNLEVSSIDAKTSKLIDEANGLGVVDVTFKISNGNYSVLKNFLSDLENNLRIFDVTSLSFPDKIDSFDIQLSAYYIQ